MILDCHEIGNETKNLGIFVERLSKNGDVFKKVWCENLGMANKTLVPQLERENIFVKQNRVMPNVPEYSTYRVSIKSLQRAGFILGASAPEGWVTTGDSFLKPPGSLFYNKLFGILLFWEAKKAPGSRHTFLVILEFGWSKPGSGEESHVTVIPNIFDNFPRLSFLKNWPKDQQVDHLCLILKGQYGGVTDTEARALLNAQPRSSTTGPIDGRIYWQHPVHKWRVSVIVKRGIVLGNRRRVIHIDYHTPVEGDICAG